MEKSIILLVKQYEDCTKTPKHPSFVNGKDDLDAYLQQFEWLATTAKWEKNAAGLQS